MGVKALPWKSGRSVRRFALTPEGGQRRWEFLGVTPVQYPVPEGDERHTALSESVAEWVRLHETCGLQQDVRVRAIVAEGAPPKRESGEYLAGALREADVARAFLQSARTPAWLLWAEERELLDPVFEPNGSTDPSKTEMAGWFVESYMLQHPRVALGVVRRREGKMEPELWRAIRDWLFSPAAQELGREVRVAWVEIFCAPTMPRARGVY